MYTGNSYPDHTCKPVLIDTEGRKRPIIGYNLGIGSQGFPRKSEVWVPEVRGAALAAAENINGYDSKPGHAIDDGVIRTRWDRKADNVPEMVGEFFSEVQAEDSRPTVTAFPLNSNRRYRFPATVQDSWSNGSSKLTKLDDQKAEKLVTPVANLRQPPMLVQQNGVRDPGNNYQPDYNSKYQLRNQQDASNLEYDRLLKKATSRVHEPTFASARGIQQEGIPTTKPTRPSIATNDVERVFYQLKEASHPTAPAAAAVAASPPVLAITPLITRPRFMVPSSATIQPKDKGHVVPNVIINSNEARRRYGASNFSLNTSAGEDNFVGIINSREAMEKYKGTILP